MFCEKCGKKNIDEAKFCSSCGNQINKIEKVEKKTGLITQNPNSIAVIFLSAIAVILMFVNVPLLVIFVVLGFSWNRLFKAHKANENKKIVLSAKIVAIIIFILVVAVWFLATYFWVTEITG